MGAKVFINGYNLLNTVTPVEGWGADEASFKGFWMWGTNFNFGAKLTF